MSIFYPILLLLPRLLRRRLNLTPFSQEAGIAPFSQEAGLTPFGQEVNLTPFGQEAGLTPCGQEVNRNGRAGFFSPFYILKVPNSFISAHCPPTRCRGSFS